MGRLKIYLLSILFLLSSCSLNYSENRDSKWLFAVYMMGDNNLSEMATYDLKEMMDVGSDENVRVVVLCDRGEGPTIYEVKRNFLEPIKVYSTLDTGNPDTFRNFLATLKESFSYEHLALVLWDHGNGWDITGVDDSSKSYLFVKNVYDVFNSTGTKVDLLGFDECLMGMMEVLYTFKDVATGIVVSEYLEPGTGWDYRLTLSKFKNSGNYSIDSFGKIIVDSYYLSYENMPDATLGYYKSETVNGILVALNDVIGFYSTFSTDFKEARKNSVSVYYYSYIDLLSFADALLNSTDSGLRAAALQLKTEVKSGYFKTTSPELRGISIYFSENKTDLIDAYFDFKFNKFAETNWPQFLKEYLGI